MREQRRQQENGSNSHADAPGTPSLRALGVLRLGHSNTRLKELNQPPPQNPQKALLAHHGNEREESLHAVLA